MEQGGRAEQAAELRRNAEGPMQDRLQQVSQLHASLARARLTTLRWVEGGFTVTLLIVLLGAAVLFRRLQVRFVRVLGMLESLANRDPLTGVLSRNAFTARLRRMLVGATAERGVGLMLFDLDNFRSLNNVEGDSAGMRCCGPWRGGCAIWRVCAPPWCG